MKFIFVVVLFFVVSVNAFAQQTFTDSSTEKESFAVGELAPAATLDVKSGKSSFGYSVAVEVTPIENWLELELGVTPTFGPHSKETDADLLFKKPWTLSPKFEFMLGIGPAWTHASDRNVTTNCTSGAAALDLMFWPFAKHQFGWYFEPEYEYGFSRGAEQSFGVSSGLLIAIL